MPFSSLSGQQQITILMALKGAAQYVSEMGKAAVATARFAAAQDLAAKNSKKANQRTFLQQQALFTARRYTFYATLAVTALVGAVARLGLEYYNTQQTASVAFRGILGSQQAVSKELNKLYVLAASSPFQFPDIVQGARRLQPFTKDLSLTNTLLGSVTDSLSGMGILTSSAFNRATLALSHMFAIGRLTGQVLFQLSRDNIPMVQALEAYYHATGLTIKQDVAAGLISATDAAKALSKYTSTDPAFKGQAFKQATKTLVGAWSTLKDLIGMSAGNSESDLFDSVRKTIQGIDSQLIKVASNRGTMSLTTLFEAIDKTMSPKTHLVINTFILLSTILKTVIGEFYLMYRAVTFVLTPLDWLGSLFGSNRLAAKALGYVLGTLITLWIIGRIQLLLYNEAFALLKLTVIQTGLVMKVLNTRLGYMAFGFALTNAAMLGWIGLALLVVGGVVLLYFKWKKFHDIVNETFDFVRQNWRYFAVAIGAAFLPITAAALAMKFIVDNLAKIKNTITGLHYNPTTGFTYSHPSKIPSPQQQPQKKQSFWKSLLTGGLSGAFATGGTAQMTGRYLVGERGAEIVNLPRGAQVTPVDNSSLSGSIAVYVYPQPVIFDSKQVGTVVATAKANRQARA